MRIKIKTILIIALIALTSSYMLKSTNKKPNEPIFIDSLGTINSYTSRPSADTQAILLSGLEKSIKLITSEMDISCNIAVNDSWRDLNIFSKEQIFSFKGHAAYITDLSSFSSLDMETDTGAYTLTIYIDEPELYNIYIDPESIQAQESRNGFLRFGQISLTGEEIQKLLTMAQEHMKTAASNPENMLKVKENTSLAITELFSSILTNAGIIGYEIIVCYK